MEKKLKTAQDFRMEQVRKNAREFKRAMGLPLTEKEREEEARLTAEKSEQCEHVA
jgi:hypothetical protein